MINSHPPHSGGCIQQLYDCGHRQWQQRRRQQAGSNCITEFMLSSIIVKDEVLVDWSMFRSESCAWKMTKEREWEWEWQASAAGSTIFPHGRGGGIASPASPRSSSSGVQLATATSTSQTCLTDPAPLAWPPLLLSPASMRCVVSCVASSSAFGSIVCVRLLMFSILRLTQFTWSWGWTGVNRCLECLSLNDSNVERASEKFVASGGARKSFPLLFLSLHANSYHWGIVSTI